MQSTRFTFDRSVSLDEAVMTLDLAVLAAGGLVAPAQVRLQVKHELDRVENALIVIGDREPFDVVVQVFTALLLREIGEGAFTVHSVQKRSTAPATV